MKTGVPLYEQGEDCLVFLEAQLSDESRSLSGDGLNPMNPVSTPSLTEEDPNDLDDLQVPLLNHADRTILKWGYRDGRLIIYPVDGPQDRVPLPASTWMLIVSVISVKVLSSAGLRYYGVRHLIENNTSVVDFIDHALSPRVTDLLADGCAISDGAMNLVTRFPKLVEHYRDHLIAVNSSPNLLLETEDRTLRTLKVTFRFFCNVSNVTSALAYFLGAVALLGKFTDVEGLLFFAGLIAAWSNLQTTNAYRLKKAEQNLNDYWNGLLRVPTFLEGSTLLLATTAFLALCYFNGVESLRSLTNLSVALIKSDQSPEQIDRLLLPYTWIFKATSGATLIPSGIVYLLSQGGAMLKAKPPVPNDAASLSFGDMCSLAHQHLRYSWHCGSGSVWRPLGMAVCWLALGYCLIAGEMIGNALTTFNGGNSLAVDLAGGHIEEDDMIAVYCTSAVITWVFSIVYFYFNIEPWVQTLWVGTAKELIKAAQDSGSLPQDPNELVRLFRSEFRQDSVQGSDASLLDQEGHHPPLLAPIERTLSLF